MRLPHSDYVNRATLPTHEHTVTALHGSDPLNTPNILTTAQDREDTNTQVTHRIAAQDRRNFGLVGRLVALGVVGGILGVVTPTCGLAGASSAWTRNALELVRKVASNLAD